MNKKQIDMLDHLNHGSMIDFIESYEEQYPLNGLIIHKNYKGIKGLFYIPSYLNEKEIEMVETKIKQNFFQTDYFISKLTQNSSFWF